MAGLPIPYALTPAVALDQRYAHMRASIARGLPRLGAVTIDDRAVLSVAAYGPSLTDTWRDLRAPIISMSGATRWLADRGVIVDYHIDMDPRANKVMTSLPAVPGVRYLVASVCCPAYFDALAEAGVDVVLWHTVSSSFAQDLAWVAEHDPGQYVVSSGSTIGLAAIQVGGHLGFRRFEIHGMDGSFADGQRHAGPHAGKTQREDIGWDAGKVTYHTSKIMANAVAETVNTCRNFPIAAVFYGRGLTQALIREADLPNACCADETEKRARIESSVISIAKLPPIQKHETVWDGLLDALEPDDLPDLVAHVWEAEPRRALARYDTGSIPLQTAVYLRALSRFYRPKVVVEVGTFIGTSTHALRASEMLYTCDRSNDCLPASAGVRTHPYATSTDMLRSIAGPVDLFFFDGRLQPHDLVEIDRLSHPHTVYAFDDYVGGEKGMVNVAILAPRRPRHLVVTPTPGAAHTLAFMAPTHGG